MSKTKNTRSCAKVWLDRLNNKILINGKDFFSIDLENVKKEFDITPLVSRLSLGENLLDSEDLDHIYSLSYGDLKRNFKLGVFSIAIGERQAWHGRQRAVFIIAPLSPDVSEMPESSFRRNALKLQWDKKNMRVRGVGRNFGTLHGKHSIGDVTDWISVGTPTDDKGHNINPIVAYNSYDEISENLMYSWTGKKKEKISTLYIKELPLMITEEGYLLCIPKTKVLPRILIVGKSGKGKCQPAGSKVLMADNTWRNIEEIKIGDEILSFDASSDPYFPKIIKSRVISVHSRDADSIYDVIDVKTNKIVYSCANNHIIPLRSPHTENGCYFENWHAEDVPYYLKRIKQKFDYKTGATTMCYDPKLKKLRDRYITVKKRRKSDKVYGIGLDSISHWYVTDNWMVTHNSFCLNSILGRVFYIYQDRVGLLNDSLNQFYDLMLPQDTSMFIPELNRIGNEPKPLPVVLLYMSCPGVKIKYQDENIGYRLVINCKEFLARWSYYTGGIESWKIGSPQKYMTKELINEIDKCTTHEQVRTILFSTIEGAHEDKGKQAMIYKWVSTFENIFREEFTSNLFKQEDSTSYSWTLKLYDEISGTHETLSGHPFIMSMEAGIVPVINNYLAKSKPIAKKQMADLMYKIIQWQMLRDEKKKRFWIFIDELKDFLGKKGDELYQALDTLFTQGRFNKIGFCGNVQEYTKLTPSMKANSTHLVIFELQTKEERKAVAQDYNIDADKVEEIANLKTFQCLFTTKEKVILYDKEGRRLEKESGIWKGKIIPPISVHRSP